MEPKRRVRRRQRDQDSPSPRRSHRVYLAYNDAELEIVTAAAARSNMAPAAWAADAALSVAKELFVPVSVDAKDVLAEFIQARNQLSRIGNNANQIARTLNADGTVTDAQLRATLTAVEKAIERMDAATRQVMRERRPRS
jgi:hypothetical protein